MAVSQSTIGQVASDLFLKHVYERPELSFRYILLDEDMFAVDLAHLLGGPVYAFDNDLRVSTSQLIEAAGPALIQTQHVPLADYLAQLAPEETFYFEDLGSFYSRYVVRRDPVRLLEEGVLPPGPIRELARANPNARDLFHAQIVDLRSHCGEDYYYEAYEEELYRPNFMLLLLDVHNISDSPARDLTIVLSTTTDNTFELRNDISGNMQNWLTEEIESPTPLGSGEHLIIPIALMVKKIDESRATEDQVATLDLRDRDGFLRLIDVESSTFAESQNRYYYLGPTHRVQRVKLGGREMSVRPPHLGRFRIAKFSGPSIGSCPLLIELHGTRRVHRGSVLVNAIGEAARRNERVKLRPGATGVVLREIEGEKSYIDYLGIVADDGAVVCRASDRYLQDEDGNYRVLRPGEEIRVLCASEAITRGDLFAVVAGYYVLERSKT